MYQSKLFQKPKEAFLITNNDSLKGLHKRIRPSLSLPLFLTTDSFKFLSQMSINICFEPSPVYAWKSNLSTCCRKTTDCFLETTDCFFSDRTVKNWINSSILSVCCRSQQWKDLGSIKQSWKPDCVLEEVTRCHKEYIPYLGNIRAFMSSQRSNVLTMCFSTLLWHFLCSAWTSLLS